MTYQDRYLEALSFNSQHIYSDNGQRYVDNWISSDYESTIDDIVLDEFNEYQLNK
jgi:hypothetical protein